MIIVAESPVSGVHGAVAAFKKYAVNVLSI
jgi:hypothetical protein